MYWAVYLDIFSIRNSNHNSAIKGSSTPRTVCFDDTLYENVSPDMAVDIISRQLEAQAWPYSPLFIQNLPSAKIATNVSAIVQ